MLKGIFDYFSTLIYDYEKLNDENIINILSHDISDLPLLEL